MRSGLGVKLAILMAAIGILASGLTGYYAYSKNRIMLVDAAQRNLLTSTQLLNRRMSSALNEFAADALFMANLPAAAKSATGDAGAKTRLYYVFNALLAAHPEYLQLRLISARQHGLELVRVDRDQQGLVRVQGLRLQEKGTFPYVFETLPLATGQIYLSRISINHEYGAHAAEGQPTLVIATPVVGPSGTCAVVVINVELASLLKMLQADLPNHFQLYLANNWGDFLIHPDPSQTFGFDRGRRILMQDSFPATQALFNHSSPSLVINGLEDPVQARDQVVAFVRKPYGQPEQKQFVVLGLAQPLRDVLTGANSLGKSIVRIVLAFSIISIALSMLFSRALTQPLNMLAHAATRFSSERALEALPLDRTDEIGILARCFDRMRSQIKSHMATQYETQQKLAYLAHHDQLTGLPNRMLFFQRLELAIGNARLRNEHLAVLFVDLDHFKEINDQLGHVMGDQVLQMVAQRLQNMVRASDTVARLGGDEFILLMEGIPEPSALNAIIDKLATSLNAVMALEQQSVRIGASIGISLFPQDGDTPEALIHHADQAMYQRKSQGRHMACFDQPG